MSTVLASFKRLAIKPTNVQFKQRLYLKCINRRYSISHSIPWFMNRLNSYRAIRRNFKNKICISIGGLSVSFGCYHIIFSNKTKNIVNASKNTFNKDETSSFSNEEWNEIAKDINKFGHSLKKSVQIHWYEYVAVIGSFFCFGIGIFLWPLWKWYFFKKTIKNLRIGRLKCRLTGSFRSYLTDVVAYYILFTIITIGIYPLFGFGFVHESHWFDTHTVWYVPQKRKVTDK
eukprot:392971_1